MEQLLIYYIAAKTLGAFMVDLAVIVGGFALGYIALRVKRADD